MMNIFRATVFFLLYVAGNVSSVMIKSLTGDSWILNNSEIGGPFAVTVPGGIYTDLMKHGVIDDIFYLFNDVKSRWVAKAMWRYFTEFEVDEAFLKHSNVDLVFEGIDTAAEITLNDHYIHFTRNMFVRYVFPVARRLKVGKNVLSVRFADPPRFAALMDRVHFEQYNYTIPPKCPPASYNGECHINQVRKMQASFAWDWGPAFPSVGIWKDVYITAYNYAVINYITVRTIPSGNEWILEVTTHFKRSRRATNGSLTVILQTNKGTVEVIKQIRYRQKDGEFNVTSNMTIPQISIDLWYPNGYGEQPLYFLNASFVSDDKSETSTKSVKIGFRTVELVQDDFVINDSVVMGATFYFRVNGVSIFAKGSNLIPTNILPELGQNETYIRYLLQSSKDVHMNMLRVWGGGVYESDVLYSIADELGIMIWQDFMFACSMYPTTPDFLTQVDREVHHQVKRLQHHPSIVLWAGNNENEAALVQNWYKTEDPEDPAIGIRYKVDYINLYVKTIKSAVEALDKSRPFLLSSPTNGIATEKEGGVSDNPYSHLFGDIHYYNYLIDGMNPNVNPIPRFASEYGYQSMPSLSTWFTATNNSHDLVHGSSFLRHRQHLPGGFAIMDGLIGHQLELPDETDYHTYIYFSQIIQAMSIKIQTEHYRQCQNYSNDIGEGMTMGALYWQLNDVWVAPSWSSIDFKGNWKMLHYFARDFFAPVIVRGHQKENGELDVYVISDKVVHIFNASVTVKVYSWDSFTPLHTDIVNVSVISKGSQLVKSYDLEKLLEQAKCGGMRSAKEKCFVYLELRGSDGRKLGPDNYNILTKLSSINITTETVMITSICHKNSKSLNIQLKSNSIALFVWLEVHGIEGRFSENGFLMVEDIKNVQFQSESDISYDDLHCAITVTVLS